MKKRILLLTLLITFISFSQQKQFQITWEGTKVLVTENFKLTVPAFSKEHYSFDAVSGLHFVAQWQSAQPINKQSLRVNNIQFAPITTQDLGGIDLKTIPTEIVYSIENTVARNKHQAYFMLSPIVKTSNGYKKVTSFSVSYTNSRVEENRSSNNNELTNSVLKNGQWFKFYIEKTGVYKLSKNFLSSLGISTNQIDPRTLKVYGNGGRMIPYLNSVSYPIDVQENAIKIVGEDDGVFNDEDYILFYGQGPEGYNEESNTNINCYTDKTYYYINLSSDHGKRITPMLQPRRDANININTFQDYQYHEVDEYNLVSLGRRWFGDKFDIEDTKTFEFSFPNLITTEPVKFKTYVASTAGLVTGMQVNVNNQNIANLVMPSTTDDVFATEASYISDVLVNSSDITVSLTHNNGGNPSALAYVDYISIEATRALSFAGNQFEFGNTDAHFFYDVGEFQISNTAEVSEIWDITDYQNITNLINSNNSADFSFKTTLGLLKTYIAVSPLDYLEPLVGRYKTVENQDLKGEIFLNSLGQFSDIDYLIITPNEFKTQAERLAEINRINNRLVVKVVTLDEIYAEFSTGNQDIGAIRNFVKYVYDNASLPQNRLKYLCLFGDGSFDYKDRIQDNTNFVPSWFSYPSFGLSNSFVADDFYGVMDAHEGTMAVSDKLDIAVGRILANSYQGAKELVDKIEKYYNEASYGSWRNNVVFVSDDIDVNWEKVLQDRTDEIGDNISEEKPFINVTKIHSDAYKQESSAGGERYPEANEALLDAIEKGAIMINYFGHGGENNLSSEKLFTKLNAINLNNTCKFNCFVTVTCEFTRFDNPLHPTAGEYTYWNKDGGAIGLITTTRSIYVDVAIDFNEKISEYLFSYSDNDDYNDNEYPSMAEALRLTKTDPSVSNSSQRRLVFFFGDPAMKLAIPKPKVVLTKINDQPVSGNPDVLQALARVKLSGQVEDASGNIMSNYNGLLSTTIYDKNIERQTLGNDGIKDGGQLIIMDYETLGAIIFRGQSSVINGEFDIEFIVPKDIGLPVGTGKVSFYAKQEGKLVDQTGASVREVQIGGLNENAAEDNVGPVIHAFMNDESFVSGGITNSSPSLILKLEDENGINTASGIGHDIVGILDGDEINTYVLNDYYQTELDNYQRGEVSYPFRDLEPGLHTLSIKAWDVYNNSSITEIQFMVFDENQKLVIDNVLNYPNPFVNYTEFWFNHNSSEPLDVLVQIFTVTGKIVKTLSGQTNGGACCNNGTSSLSRDMVWDGRDDFGDKIGKGVYIYKLTVRSPSLNKTVEKVEKLVIL